MKTAIPRAETPYGQDLLVSLPLIDAGAQDYLATIPTIAAGDAKLWIDDGATGGVANPTARILGFDSMSVLPSQGDVLGENAGDGVATVMFVVLVAGTVGGGNASGFMFVKTVSGTWSDNSTINNTTTSASDIGTVDAGTTGVYTLATNQLANTAGLFAFALSRAWVAVTAAEAASSGVSVRLVDTAAKEWEDTSADFVTVDHPLAGDPQGALYAGVATSVAAGTLVGANVDGVGHPLSAEAAIAPCLVVYIEDATLGAGQAVPVASFTHGTRTFTLLHNWPLTPTGTISYKVYSIARMPAHVMSAATGVSGITSDDLGIIEGEVDDAAALTYQFEVDTDVGSDILTGSLKFTSGDLAGESRDVTWTGTTVTVIRHWSRPPKLRKFSAAPANGVTFEFSPKAF